MDEVVYVDSDIVINEIMAANDFTASDEMGEFDDWIEIYNKGNEIINLAGLYLSYYILELDKYAFPSVTLNPESIVSGPELMAFVAESIVMFSAMFCAFVLIIELVPRNGASDLFKTPV